MRSIKNINIPGSAGKRILLDVFFKSDGQAKPAVIFIHGFKGFKDWGHFNRMAERFAAEDLVFVKFNFSHNGTTPAHPDEFADLEAFGNNNYIYELDDTKTVIDWVQHNELLKAETDIHQIYLLGHSRGGGIAILKAFEDHRIRKLVTWAAVSDFVNRNKKRTIDTWKKDGVVYTTNTRTGQRMPLYLQFYNIMIANKDRLNILRAAGKLQIPYLIIHGTADEAVDVKDAEALHRSAQHAKLCLVEGAGHAFGVKHPFRDSDLPAQAEEVIRTTLAFFKK